MNTWPSRGHRGQLRTSRSDGRRCREEEGGRGDGMREGVGGRQCLCQESNPRHFSLMRQIGAKERKCFVAQSRPSKGRIGVNYVC
jgi:hypothetical protein